MTKSATADGHPDLEGVFNLRDLGGLTTTTGETTASGIVFRADGLHRSPVDQRVLLSQMGIRKVVDLRTPEEVEREGRFEHEGISFVHVPIIESLSSFRDESDRDADEPGGPLTGHYLTMTNSNGTAFARAFDELAETVDNKEAVVFHCTAGKDRTGMLAALLLAGLGGEDELVAADYGLSRTAVPRMTDWYRENSDTTPEVRMRQMGFDPKLAEVMMSAEPSTMLSLLQRLRTTHGSVGAYLDRIGASKPLTRLSRHLLV